MIRITKDGRTIRTGRDYTEFRREVYADQKGQCGDPKCDLAQQGGRVCSLMVPLEWDEAFHLNHLSGRGGGKRDDVMFRNGRQVCRGDCGKCHRVFHGQQGKVPSRLHWSKSSRLSTTDGL